MVETSTSTFEETLLSLFAQTADALGLPKSPALIYGLIFASPTPLSFADIETRLQLSKGSVSQGLRLLKEIGAIKTAETNGDRREHFEPDLELRRLIQRFLESKIEPQLVQSQSRLVALRTQLPPEHAIHYEVLEERVTQLENWHSRTRKLLPILRTLLVLRRP